MSELCYYKFMTILHTSRLKIYVEEKGEGSTVLLISGTGGDLRVKPSLLEGPLSEHHHVVSYDQRGLGQTEKPEGPYTMADYADDAAEILETLGHEKADVVGVSFGGMVAQHLAIRHPQKVNSLVLCCTSPGGDMPSYPFHDLPSDITPVERLIKLMPISDTRRDQTWQTENMDIVNQLIAYTVRTAIADHSTPEFKRGARLQLEARRNHDTNRHLPDLEIPTFIAAGRYDGIAPPENQERLKRLIKGAKINWYEGGHLFLFQDKKAWPDILKFLGS